MKKALAVIFALGISVVYAASTYHVTLYKPTTINGTQLKPGDVKLELQGDKVVIKQGKTSVESSVTVENGAHKFDASSVGYVGDSTNNQIQEIRLGGTTTKLLFEAGAKTAATTAGGGSH
jgi:hypothetical protein